ncbi:hypothetical protein [Amycolatopsis sp. NPDC001319]|uniref:hypothetical protein n=1 Tax=unclassified Amycolatopsis TaxID=2618356 RepID=UPI0036BF0507
MPANDETPHQRLARAVRDRRVWLGLSVRAASRLASVSRGTWQALEDATRVIQSRNYGGVQRALQWPIGQIESLLAGRISVADATKAPLIDNLATPQSDASVDLRDDVERKLWAITDLSEDERWAYIFQHRARQERRYGE